MERKFEKGQEERRGEIEWGEKKSNEKEKGRKLIMDK